MHSSDQTHGQLQDHRSEHAHVLLSSNRWYSAATEYALRLCEHLHHQGQSVRIFAHEGSPLLSKAQALGLSTRIIGLRAPGGRALGGVGFLRLLLELRTLFRSLRSLRCGKIFVWVLEGHEHTVVSLVRRLWGFRDSRIVVVRLRMQDRFESSAVGVWFAGLVARGTDHVVFPSHFAREKFFQKQPQLISFYRNKGLVQHFCKDFPVVSKTKGPLEFCRTLEWTPDVFTFVAVARFDPIKGIEDLISAFARFTEQVGGHHASSRTRKFQLVICGRTENVAVETLWTQAARLLGEQARDGNCYLAWSPETSERKPAQIVLVDGFVSELPQLLRLSDCAVISSLGSEIICRTAVEFLQAGLPIVSTRVGSLVETIGPEYEPGDPSVSMGCGFYVSSSMSDAPGTDERVAALAAALLRAWAALHDERERSGSEPVDHRGALTDRCRVRGRRFALDQFSSLVKVLS